MGISKELLDWALTPPPERIYVQGKKEIYAINPRAVLGGTGNVQRAQGVESGKEYAVKVRGVGFGSNAFYREIALHEGIRTRGGMLRASLEEVVERGSQAYSFFKYIPGVDVAHILKYYAPLSLADTYRLFSSLCDEVHKLHQLEVVHRDIKPANIGLHCHRDFRNVPSQVQATSLSNPLFVFDLNISHAPWLPLELHDKGKLVIGTPVYVAPEAWKLAAPHHTQDIYALAVIAFEALTKRFPFHGVNPKQTGEAHVFNPIPSACALSPSLPTEVDVFLGKGLAKNPDHRYQSALDFKEGLRQLV